MSSRHLPVALAGAPAPEELVLAAALEVPVLVSAATAGERSTYARLLHARSRSSEQRFVELQCSQPSDAWIRWRPITQEDLKTSFLRARGGTLSMADSSRTCSTD
jgi:hypothetical protein